MSYRVRFTNILVLMVFMVVGVGCEAPTRQAPLHSPAPTVFGSVGAGHSANSGSISTPHPNGTKPDPAPTTEVTEKEALLAFQLPLAAVSNPVTMAVSSAEGTVRVVYREGSEVLGTGLLPSTGFAIGVNFSSPGAHIVTASAYDVGDVLLGETSHMVQVLSSHTGTGEAPPATVQFLEPQWDTVDNPVTFAVSASPSVIQVQYWEHGGDLVGVSDASDQQFEFTHIFGKHGSVVMEARGMDSSGEVIAKAAKALFVSPPPQTGFEVLPEPEEVAASVSFVSPGAGVLQSPMTLAVEAEGDVARVQYWLDQSWIVGDSWLPSTGFAVTCNVGVSGEHTIEARAYDSEQNLVALDSRVVVVEAPYVMTNPQEGSPQQEPPPPAPAVGFVLPVATAVVGTAQFKVTSQGAVASVSYLVDGLWEIGSSQQSNAGFPLTYTFTVAGTLVVTAQARDASQQVIATAQKTIQVTLPPQPAPAQPSSPAPQPSPGGTSGATTCGAGELPDCNGVCAKKEWINDGICDDGSQYSTVFTCSALGMDGSDCGQQSASPCTEGKIPDCQGACAKPEWINDGICDDGSQYSTVLTCPGLGGDGNDCSGTSAGGSQPAAQQPSGNSTPTQAPAGLPYFSQYDNDLHPSATCQNTSIAMVLASLGWSGEPDDITQAWGKNHAQSPAGLAEVFNSYAQSMGSSAQLIPHMNGTIGGLQALLAAGKPTVIHGYFTKSGHVVVATGYTGTHYTAHDPAGKWSQTFKGGYWGSYDGAGVVYGAAAFEKAVSTLDGSTYAPLWYHELVQ